MRIMTFVVTALIAAGLGILAVLAFHDVAVTPAADATPSASASPSAPAGGGSASLLPPGTGGGVIPTTGPGQTVRLAIGGRVTAVSATSITLRAGSQQVTASVTKATVVTGKVHDIAGIKAGDLVAAQITGTSGKLTATSLQDPASLP